MTMRPSELKQIRSTYREQRKASRERFKAEAEAVRQQYKAERGTVYGYRKSPEYKQAEKRESQRQRQYNTRERKQIFKIAERIAGPAAPPVKRLEKPAAEGAGEIDKTVFPYLPEKGKGAPKPPPGFDIENVPGTPFWNMPKVIQDQTAGAPAAVVKIKIEGEKGISFDLKKPGDFYKLTKEMKGLYKRFMKDATGKRSKTYWAGSARTVTMPDGKQIIEVQFARDTKQEIVQKKRRKGRDNGK